MSIKARRIALGEQFFSDKLRLSYLVYGVNVEAGLCKVSTSGNKSYIISFETMFEGIDGGKLRSLGMYYMPVAMNIGPDGTWLEYIFKET